MDVIMFAELLHEDFVSCGADEFTSPIDFFVLLTWTLKFLEEPKNDYLWSYYYLDWRRARVCV
jgi:hypothetical protein